MPAADDEGTGKDPVGGPDSAGGFATGATGATASGPRPAWRRPVVRRAIALATLLAVIGTLAALLPRLLAQSPEPVYVAMVTSLTGPGAPRSPEISRGIRFHAEQVNRAGGIHGHLVRLLVYDDGADPDGAQRTARRIVRDNRVALVIGNTSSTTALAAAPVYAAAGIPFITPTATADSVTDNLWCFRATFTNTYQGGFIAAYAQQVLGARSATVLQAATTYGTSLAEGFRRAFSAAGIPQRTITLDDRDDGLRSRQLKQALTAIDQDRNKGPVLLAVPEHWARDALAFLRSHGVTNTVIGGDDLSSDDFAASLATSAQERADPGSMTGRFYAASPQLDDSLTGSALKWSSAYRAHYGTAPNWKAMSGQTAADLAVHALRQVKGIHGRVTRHERTSVRDALAAVNSRQRSIRGLYGRISFDANRSLHLPVTLGIVKGATIVSAPLQLTELSSEEGIDTADEVTAGRAITFHDKVLARQQIVYTGINVNRVSTLDTAKGTFKADFFLWLRYTGSDNAANVYFPNLADNKFKWPEPVHQSTDGDTKYRLYQIATTFTAPLDFHRFPWDRQHLKITVQNHLHPSSRVVYVVDKPLVNQDRAEALRSGRDVADSIDGLPNWAVEDLALYKGTVGSTARLGDPDLVHGGNGVHFAQYVADVTVARNVGPFLVKNLLPLLLSVAVTYATLFFPRDPRYTGTRVSLEVTAMLSAAVLLTNVTGSLPDIGYSVALEWAYYAFMFLVGTCVFISLAGAWYEEHRNIQAWNRLARVSRVYYPVFCVAVLLTYVVLLR